MNIPGFNGDLSIYKSAIHYQTAAQLGDAFGPSVSMALPIRNGGGGNGGPRCTPHCGPCLPDSSFPSGCSKECITVTCEDVSISCTGCNCATGLSRCGTRCVNLSNDPRNCGGCANVCPRSESCVNGRCVCSPPSLICGGVCTNPQTDPDNCGSCGNACSGSQICCNGTCTGTVAATLASSSNYFFDNACQNLSGLTITLDVTQTMASATGFSIQLNADSPAGTALDAAQQYGFTISGNTIQGFINNWTNATTAIVCDQIDLCSTPINNGLPAGYTLSLSLTTDANSNVTGAVYQVFDGAGNQLANKSFTVAQAGCHCNFAKGSTCTGFKAGDLSPITTFTVVVVGPGGGSNATFSAGAGNIGYSLSSGQLTPLGGKPRCVATGLVTAETSNAGYGALNGCPAQSVVQPFFVTPVTPKVCFTTNGPCTGAGGADQCLTLNGITQCCHSNWLYGWWPWITGCSDLTVANQGCSGPCY